MARPRSKFAVSYIGGGTDDFKNIDGYAIYTLGSSLLVDDTKINGYVDYAIVAKDSGTNDHMKLYSTLSISTSAGEEAKLNIDGTNSYTLVRDLPGDCDGDFDHTGDYEYLEE